MIKRGNRRGMWNVECGMSKEMASSDFSPYSTFSIRHSRKSSAFTIIELLVSMAIVGLLTAAVLPSLNRFSRNNGVVTSAQLVREALNESSSYATSPDPSVCPVRAPFTTLSLSINQYALFIGTSAATPSPTDYTPAGVTAGNLYECGQAASAISLSNTQFAIVARYVDPTDPTNPAKSYTLGIVRVGALDKPAIFIPPVVGAAAKPILVGYSVGSASFGYYNSSGANYLSTHGQNVLSLGVTYTISDAKYDNLYLLVGLSSSLDPYQIIMFINSTTGQVTSSGRVPTGYN